MFVDKYGGDVVGVAFKLNVVYADAAFFDFLFWLFNFDFFV